MHSGFVQAEPQWADHIHWFVPILSKLLYSQKSPCFDHKLSGNSRPEALHFNRDPW